MTNDNFSEQFSFREILSLGWAIFNSNLRTIVWIYIIVYGPIRIMLYFLDLEVANLYVRIYWLLEMLIGVIATMAVAFLTEGVIFEHSISLKEALMKAVSRWLPAIGTSIIAKVQLFLLTLLFIIPGIMWAVYFAFVPYVIILRGQYGRKALEYSETIVKGKWWRVLGICVGILSIPSLFSFFIALISVLLFGNNHLVTIVIGLISDISFSFATVANTVFFLSIDSINATVTTSPNV